MATNASVGIKIDQLRVGMFVTKLDIPWLDSPFLTHTRLIRDFADIDALVKSGVKQLVIDTSKGCNVDMEHQPELSNLETGNPVRTPQLHETRTQTKVDPLVQAQQSSSRTPAEIAKTPFTQEIAAALSIRNKVKKTIDQLQNSFELGNPIVAEELTPLVDSTLRSLERNDQALMSLVHLSRKAQKLADHTFGTFCLVLNLALIRGVSEQDREELGLAALLHEAGWAQLPLNLMGKRTRYNANEKNLVERHTLVGDKILATSALPELTRRIVAEHHELLDGSGYPQGLTETQIHPLTHILSVVDAYEERVHQLGDTPGMIPTNALRSLYQDVDKGLYSAEVVASLIGMLGIYPATAAVLLNTGEKAIVKTFQHESPLQPIIRIIYDAQGNLLNPVVEVDLSQQNPDDCTRVIESALDPTSKQVDPLRRLIVGEGDYC